MALQLTTPSFQHGGEIPAKHTADGRDVSPELHWTGPPAGTKSFALIVDDPDAPDPKAPKMVWVHWVLYDLPAAATSLPEGTKRAPAGAHDGVNDWKATGWRGPDPPIGRHRYFFKLHALDVVLGDQGPLTRAQLEKAMEGHVLARAELMGTYEKKG